MTETDILHLIGNTPLLQLHGFDTGPCTLFLKLETQNPGGSIKDRMALYMIRAAERSGQLPPGGTIIEATAGNTGLGLALVAVVKGYRLVLVIPDKMSQEKIAHLRALGAEIRLTRSDVSKGHPDFYQDYAARLATEIPNSIYIDQFSNPANPQAHEETTGPEIWEQMEHRLDAVVCGVGSAGTMTGLSRFFARVDPNVALVLADPQGSGLAEYITTGRLGKSGPSVVEGIGSGAIAHVADLSRVHHAFTIPDAESLHVARELLRIAGLLAGSSSGTLVAGALRYCREQTAPKRVVSFICDSGNKYLSKMFNDYWMRDQGFLPMPKRGDLRDLISRRYEDGAVITVGPEDTLLTAFQRMRMADISQVPVIENGQPIGILDESDVLMSVHADPARFHEPVRTGMTSRLETLSADCSLADVFDVLDRGKVALIVDQTDHNTFIGLITRTDLINHLRRKLP
ncbi:MAG: pyridoxal-phosphate dependent enzyme [Acidobacteriota bacterium]|nr:pyridoxal-phosphate dependent enzyme [Acidobacteriota bacterium]